MKAIWLDGNPIHDAADAAGGRALLMMLRRVGRRERMKPLNSFGRLPFPFPPARRLPRWVNRTAILRARPEPQRLGRVGPEAFACIARRIRHGQHLPPQNAFARSR